MGTSELRGEPIAPMGATGCESVPAGWLTFRTVWGGPSPQAGYIEELGRIKQCARVVEFAYHFDLFLTVGGEITPVPPPSGLRSPRVFPSRRTVTGEIRIGNAEVSAANDPIAFLRHTIHTTIDDLISRIAARDTDFDAGAGRGKIAFLIEEGATPGAQADAEAALPPAERKNQ